MPGPKTAASIRSRALACAAAALALATVVCAIRGTAAARTQVTIAGSRWLINGRPPHEGSPAEGLLTNVRMVNAVFEDTGPAAPGHLGDFDPQRNTSLFIDRIPAYVAQGVVAFTIGLQGGFPGYEGAVNSAFERDGSLRSATWNASRGSSRPPIATVR